ncbi:hypothetical protein [Amycolatopsis japonica]|uniref:hypothetical protein n=1 Tax=Amycolatopsis japonica TaxID=208439 RepID=UPI0033E83DDD
MRKTMARFIRAVAVVATGVAVATGLAALNAPAASAGGCVPPVCGGVWNNTSKTMSVTVNLGSGSGHCDVWNYDGGTTNKFKYAKCDQLDLGRGTFGGPRNKPPYFDVDAFTYNGQGYHERFGPLGTWHWRTKGVWTKIRDYQFATCNMDDGQIWCTILPL